MNSNSKVRISGIDLIKILAFLFVIMLHFTSYYYTKSPNPIAYILLNSFKWLCFSCIALFMISTGYLNSEKELNKKYFKKFISFIIVFFFYCILTGFIVNARNERNIFEFIFDNIRYYFLGFNSYFWYVNFYFSFFFIMPFLGIINKNINRRQHLLLILILILLIVIPQSLPQLGDFSRTINSLQIKGLSYFSADNFVFVYFFIGSYIKKYCDTKKFLKFKINWFIILILSLVIHSLIDLYYLNLYQGNFNIGEHIYTFHYYGNIFTILTGISIFMILKDIMINNKTINKAVSFLGGLTFEMYLGLIISDRIVKIITDTYNITLSMNFQSFIIWTVIEVFAALSIAIIYYFIKKLFIFIFNKMITIIKNRKYVEE